MGTNLIYDPNSIVNKSGKFECRYTVPGSYDKNIGVGLLEAKIYSGYDMLKIEFDNNQKDIADGKKAIGKFAKIRPSFIRSLDLGYRNPLDGAGELQ